MIKLDPTDEGYTLTDQAGASFAIPRQDAPAVLGLLLAAITQRKDDRAEFVRGHEEGLAEGYRRARREADAGLRSGALRRARDRALRN